MNKRMPEDGPRKLLPNIIEIVQNAQDQNPEDLLTGAASAKLTNGLWLQFDTEAWFWQSILKRALEF